ncbi:hypothetical protein ES703_42095 [subsurface metagenome]
MIPSRLEQIWKLVPGTLIPVPSSLQHLQLIVSEEILNLAIRDGYIEEKSNSAT